MAKITSTMCGAVAGALLAGCSGAVSTQRVDTTMLDQPGEKVSGVVYYPPALFAEITTRTAYVNDGKLLGLATDSPPACAEVTTKKLVMLPDLTNPHTIQYKPGLFESAGTFGVSLRDGMLAAVNAAPSSERSQLLPALAPGGSPLAGRREADAFFAALRASAAGGRRRTDGAARRRTGPGLHHASGGAGIAGSSTLHGCALCGRLSAHGDAAAGPGAECRRGWP